MPIVEIKGVGQAQFPDNMPIADIRNFLRNKYYKENTQTGNISLDPAIQTAEPYNPSLAERAGGAIAQGLKSTGLISDNYGAQQIGKNVTALGEMLPGVGDATAGDEFGRAAAQDDLSGMGWASLGAIPIVGDVLKKLPISEISRLPYKEKVKIASEWETGRPIKLSFARNTESSKSYPAGMDFGQDIEPAGRYMNVDFDDSGFNKNIPNWEFGEVEFKNPLVLEHKSTNSTGWKKDLSEMFGGSTGKRLSNKIKKAGYDGIITKDADGFNETIKL